jgi:hypothetical protein
MQKTTKHTKLQKYEITSKSAESSEYTKIYAEIKITKKDYKLSVRN